MGRSPVLSLEEEAKLVSHLKEMALIGYGYTRQEVVDLASEYAADLDIYHPTGTIQPQFPSRFSFQMCRV
jgi:hypothetical protein